MIKNNKYSLRGVSHKKEDVHSAIKQLKTNEFSGAFCSAIPLQKNISADEIFLMHADGAGTKSSLAYLYWKETGDKSIFRNIAHDALIMNTDDLLCVGAIDNFIFSSTLGRNKHLISREIISEIISANDELIQFLNDHGIQAQLAGGETADVGDVVKTLIVDATAVTTMKKEKFIHAKNIAPNQVIVGFASFGKSNYEKEYNSGIGSNGLTSARHDLLKKNYLEKYPETFDAYTDKEYIYNGNFQVTDNLQDTSLTIGKALLSPTRTYLPMMKEVLKNHFENISAILHCTGGGQSKCLHFSNGIHYIKNNVFPLPPLFKTLAEKTSMQEMFQIYNCGHRLEIYTDDKTATDLISIAESFNIEAKKIGYTESYSHEETHEKNHKKNKLTIEYENQKHVF